MKTWLNSYEDTDFFEGVSGIKKYDAIFVDEVQDFTNEWLRIINDYFLKENGEFVVFGDPKQNIYGRELNKLGEINLGVIGGVWNKTLQTSHRLTNQTLSRAAIAFQRHFMSEFENDGLTIADNQQPTLDFNPLQYIYVGSSVSHEDIWKSCASVLSNEDSHKGFAILANSRDLLRDIDYYYRKGTGRDTTITFVRKEDFEDIEHRQYRYDFQAQQDLEALESVAKKTFTTATPSLKLSTIHSFKGWETDKLILIIGPNDGNALTSPALFYTALTRAKEEICVINIGNSMFHKFFNEL